MVEPPKRAAAATIVEKCIVVDVGVPCSLKFIDELWIVDRKRTEDEGDDTV